ncbi:hypothetical protein [Prevotella sp. 10(H)]|uniref:hypothetical protein n=1 Tax=Prevotella sp. 10(H) TaxID=1158294 RepID=UPI0004A767E4|nr:hypothetical protein [Prevotella sp. 10(H)]
MIKIKAEILLYKDGRTTPFISGYRPAFDFIPGAKTSGKIELIDCSHLYPGQRAEVFIYFLTNKYLGEDFSEGNFFTFGEGGPPLGEGIITEIISLA